MCIFAKKINFIMKITNRMGAKTRLIPELQKHFPAGFDGFIDLFFGGGSMTYFVAKNYKNTKVIANDIDKDISNLFFVIKKDFRRFCREVENTPLHQEIFNEYKKTKQDGSDLERAVKFWILANYSYNGTSTMMKVSTQNNYRQYINSVKEFYKIIHKVLFISNDFEKAINSIEIKNNKNTFIYADPPYLNTTEYAQKWTESDANRLIDILINSKCKFMISEFNNEFYKQKAKKYNLNYIYLKNRNDGLCSEEKTEVIITNYRNHSTLF